MSNLIYIVLLFLLVWLIVISYYLYKLVDKYNRLTYGVNKKAIGDVIGKILVNVDKHYQKISKLEEKTDEIIKSGKSHIQKIGMVRFNPFTDTGGNQSFVLSILDESDTGVVLTSLHTRDVTRWYLKSVKDGKGVNCELSQEELKAVKNSQKKNKVGQYI